MDILVVAPHRHLLEYLLECTTGFCSSDSHSCNNPIARRAWFNETAMPISYIATCRLAVAAAEKHSLNLSGLLSTTSRGFRELWRQAGHRGSIMMKVRLSSESGEKLLLVKLPIIKGDGEWHELLLAQRVTIESVDDGWSAVVSMGLACFIGCALRRHLKQRIWSKKMSARGKAIKKLTEMTMMGLVTGSRVVKATKDEWTKEVMTLARMEPSWGWANVFSVVANADPMNNNESCIVITLYPVHVTWFGETKNIR